MEELYNWLSGCPVFGEEKLNLNYLPSYRGWSLTMKKSKRKTDILGNWRLIHTMSVSRRLTVSSNEDRLRIYDDLVAVAEWAERNPPAGWRVRRSVPATYERRASSGTEDYSVELVATSPLYT